jgi:hypothetical protein
MSYLVDKIKELWYGQSENLVETGYTLLNDNTNNKTLILKKENDLYWKTKWVDHTSVTINTPSTPIVNIFNTK